MLLRPATLALLMLATAAAAQSPEGLPIHATTAARTGAPPALVPLPASAVWALADTFVVTRATPLVAESPEAAPTAAWLAALLGPPDERPSVLAHGVGAPAIRFTRDGADASLGDEGYRLDVSRAGIVIRARAAAGFFYGAQTLRQLLPPDVEYTAALARPLPVPGVAITDAPRFRWRGAMLDVARHFFGPDDVMRYIDLMALHKLNRLHLHLSDDQGWRVEIPAWPRLAEVGGRTQVGGGPGGYYTSAEYGAIVRYAAERHVTVVPEIDMPGHINAALVAYPELACDDAPPEPYTGIRVGFSALCVGRDTVYAFVEAVVAELAARTPGPYFHLGGDEVKRLPPEAFRAFLDRAQAIVTRHGKRVVGWDEVAAADLVPGALVQLWRPVRDVPPDAVLRAVAGGARVILSPADHVYLDMKYDAETVLGLRWAGLTSVRDAYDWEPSDYVPGLPEDAIEGVEAPLWTETAGTRADLEYLAFPRLAGVAEIGWTPAGRRSWDDYRQRLGAQAPRWTALGVHFYRAPEVPWQDGPRLPAN